MVFGENDVQFSDGQPGLQVALQQRRGGGAVVQVELDEQLGAARGEAEAGGGRLTMRTTFAKFR